MRQVRTLALAAGALLLAGCVAGSAESQHAATGGALSQALLGFWHGVIAPATLVVEIVDHFAPHALPWTAHLYEAQGTGVAYDIGFYLGLAGGPSMVFSRRRRGRVAGGVGSDVA